LPQVQAIGSSYDDLDDFFPKHFFQHLKTNDQKAFFSALKVTALLDVSALDNSALDSPAPIVY